MKARKPKTPPVDTATKPADHAATTGYEAELWRMADALLPKLVSMKFAGRCGGV